jgi:putative phosphoserine phosphatase/1-acylglycerol-3-phosphate O-acyltransferase
VGAAFIDLDRTLLRHASGRVLNAALGAQGVVDPERSLPGQGVLYRVYDRFGENLVSMALARGAARVAKGWSQAEVRKAAELAVGELRALVAPFAFDILAEHRRAGRKLVLATTTPEDMVAAFAESMGFDDIIATRYQVADGHYTGRITGRFVWGTGKLAAVRRWAEGEGIDLADCHAFSDSFFDLPLLSSVGTPHAVNPDPRLLVVATARRWPIEHWDRPSGVPSVLGLEPQDALRLVVRPEAFPYARFEIEAESGPVLLAANHRSYFDVVALALVAARLGRPVRFLGKKELFEPAPLGWVARAIGGIRVDRGSGSDRPLREAEAALRAGEIVVVLPQGTIPRGPAFFDPVLHGKTGTARIAAATGATVVPIGIWGTEHVWPRSARGPDVLNVLHPPDVRIAVGPPVELGHVDAIADTSMLMAAISALLPPDAHRVREPSAEELARTYPPGKAPADPSRAAG